MADANDCIICLEPVHPSPNDYDTYTILQSCICLYTAHPACIAQWVRASNSCPICHETSTVGMRQSVIQAVANVVQRENPQAENQDNASRVTPNNNNTRRQGSQSCCCTIS